MESNTYQGMCSTLQARNVQLRENAPMVLRPKTIFYEKGALVTMVWWGAIAKWLTRTIVDAQNCSPNSSGPPVSDSFLPPGVLGVDEVFLRCLARKSYPSTEGRRL